MDILITLVASIFFSAAPANSFGEKITTSSAAPLCSVIEKNKEGTKEVLTISGKATKVCQKKGCWMVIEDGTCNTRVTFKGYSFFVPFSIKDKNIHAQGNLVKKTQSVDEQKHYLQDEGKPQSEIDKITSPKVTWEFVASGVKIVN